MKVIVMCGLPGSGKSYFAEKYCKNHDNFVIVSSDKIREELFGNVNDLKHNDYTFLRAYELIISYLLMRKNVIFDATNIEKKYRIKLISSIKSSMVEDIEFICVNMTTPKEICIFRDKNRNRSVGEKVINKLYNKFEEPTYDEGWNSILTNSLKIEVIGDFIC